MDKLAVVNALWSCCMSGIMQVGHTCISLSHHKVACTFSGGLTFCKAPRKNTQIDNEKAVLCIVSCRIHDINLAKKTTSLHTGNDFLFFFFFFLFGGVGGGGVCFLLSFCCLFFSFSFLFSFL